DGVRAAHGQPRRGHPEPGAGGQQGPHHEVALVQRDRAGALAGHLDGQPGAGDLDLHLVVEREGEAERVEGRPQVRAGGGDPDLHASSSAAATAVGSTGTGSTSSMPRSAVSGSFRPWPVTVQTTSEPAGKRPSAAVISRPATLVADAGSTKTA